MLSDLEALKNWQQETLANNSSKLICISQSMRSVKTILRKSLL